ncbi:hypothetical protein A6770_07100 [Nostoc minutum NIES-26]|uniref:Carbohydrate kinase FGGY N-terminal domain-containing protein n=1 Tax=Nostoc minutum NIES-26 TaxID=1844469 RepID=A0A367S3N2_9NOSO|nr:hypothetical protein A6770_07100 [Nostoc minutum NIES-26]
MPIVTWEGQLIDIVVGLDLGTGGVRSLAIDLQGQIIAQATRSYPLLTPQPGWTEQNSSDWVEASLDALFDVSRSTGAFFAPAKYEKNTFQFKT